MRRSLLCAAVTLAALAGGATAALAQGSAVMTHSSCATAMGAAGVASPCEDGSAVLFNPASMALQSSVVGVGWTGVSTASTFTYNNTLEEFSNDAGTSSVPFGFASFRIGERLAAGIGVYNPYGLRVNWGEDAATEFEGRYVSHDTQLRNIYVQPTLAYAPASWLSLGIGLDVVLGSIEINQVLDLATTGTTTPGVTFGNLGIPAGSDFARAKLEGSGTGYTFNFGAVADVHPMLSLGVRYMHSAVIDYDGTADFTQLNTGLVIPGNSGHPLNPTSQPLPLDAFLQQQVFTETLADQDITTSLEMPSQLVFGVALRPLPSLKVLADYQITGWDAWDAADINFANQDDPTVLVLDYSNTSTYRLGAQLDATEALALRAGFIYNEAAQGDYSVSSLLPEAERNYYSVGAGYTFGNGLGLDVGYQLVDQSDRLGRVRGRAPGMTEAQLEALNVGVYSVDAHVFNITAHYRFGARR